MVPTFALAAALLAAAGPASPGGPAGEVVETVVAVVRNPPGAAPRLLTLTRLREEARIALVSRGAVEAAFRPLDEAALRAALSWWLDETLVADESARLRVDALEREAVAAELAAFRARFAGPAEYARFLAGAELAEEELEASLARSLRVRRYLEGRVGRGARVADDEVEAFVKGRGLAAPGPDAREVVRSRLVEEHATGQVRALLSDLRGRADVRILEPGLRRPAAGPAAPGGEGG